MKKRVCALLLSWVMLAGLLPGAFAAGEGFTVTGGTAGTDYAITDGVLHIKTGKKMTVSGGTVDAPMTGSILVESGVTANLTFDKLYLISVENMAAVKLDNAALNLSMGQDTVTPAAEEGVEDTVIPAAALKVNCTKGNYPAVIQVDGGSLTIQEGGTLETWGNSSAAGIGTKRTSTSLKSYAELGSIVIKGGVVRSYGNPAIGSGETPSGKNGVIEINGGTVIVERPDSTTNNPGIVSYGGAINITSGDVRTRTYTAVGIGGNNCVLTIEGENTKVFARETNGNAIGGEENAIVNIKGGTVTAMCGGTKQAAIGGGRAEKRAAVNISGGVVTAVPVGNGNGNRVCGIGGDYCDVAISGGVLEARGGGYGGAGIGGYGNDVYHGTVTISGGAVTAIGGNGIWRGAGIGTTGTVYDRIQAFGPEAKVEITGGIVYAYSGGANAKGIGEGDVDNGTLTDNAAGWFQTTDSKTGKPGNAVIFTSEISDGFSCDNEDWSGLVILSTSRSGGGYDNKAEEWTHINEVHLGEGKVQGNVTLKQSLELPKGAVVDIPHGSTLNIAKDATLTMPKAFYNPDPLLSGTRSAAATEYGYFNTTINNHGTVNDHGTLTIAPRDPDLVTSDDSAHFVNESDGVFNWYGTVNGTMDTSASGNIVNYPSTVTVSVDTATPTYGDEVTFTATVSRVVKDANTAITAAGGVVDFYLDGAKEPFASVDATLDTVNTDKLTAQTKVFAVGEDWKAGSKHTVTAKYRDGEGVTGDAKAQQLPAEAAQAVEVTVGKKALEDTMVGDIADVTFNGKAQEPAVTVTHKVNGKNAITGKDYTVTYADNLNAGIAKVTVKAADNGNYSGSVEKTFTINKASSDPDAVTVNKNLYFAQANQVQIDLGAKLPKDRGTTSYTVTGEGAPVTGTPAVSGAGVLSFSTAAGSVDDANTFAVKAEMQNYTDVTFTVKVTLKDKTLLTVSGVSIAGAKDGKRVYDGAPAAYTGTPVTNEPGYADGFTYAWYSVSDNGDALLSAAPSKVGSYKLVVAVSDESELYRGQQEIPFTIEKAPITVSAGSYKVSKTYDGTTAAGAGKGELALEGVCGEDKVSVTAVPGAYAAKNAGEDLSVEAALTLAGADSGNYALKNATLTVPASIARAPLSVTAATVADKTYDGKTDGTVTDVTITGAVNGETLTLGTDYKAVAAFADANAGTGKTAAVTLELLNGNYTMSETAFTATANIDKAVPPAARDLSVDVANHFAKEYTVRLSNGLAKLDAGKEYGQVRYTASLTYEMSEDTVVIQVADGALKLDVGNIDSDVEYEKAFIVTVRAESGNYTDVEFNVNVNTVNRIVSIGAPTVEGSLSYGQKLSELKLGGEMKDGDKTVEGDFAWAEPDSVPTVSVTKAGWTFTPADEETYLAISGEADIVVKKAVPAGRPAAAFSSGSGKTLADAALEGEFTNPNNDAAVVGTLAWTEAPTTEVKANTEYEWSFTPDDGDNYETVTGKLTLYRVSYDNVPTTGGSSSSSTKNEDGSVTKTVTNKRTGTVTETTTMANGDKLVVETKKDGTVTETFTGKDGSRRETVTQADGSLTMKVTTADDVKADSAVTAQGELTATVTVPKKAEDTTVALPIPAAIPGKSEIRVDVSVSATLLAPVQEATTGTVAVIVGPDGKEEVIRSSVLDADGLKFSVTGSVTVKIIDNSKSFSDVPGESWYAGSVDFVSAREMLTGTGEETFSPTAPTTRAMLMTILARYDGVDTAGGGSWYEKGMAWAKEKGVSDGSMLESVITREQLATMLYRYAGKPGASGSLSAFQDAASVSSFAQEALQWAVEQGIITGKLGGVLDPLGNATRAEVAAMLERFVVWSVK